MSVKDKIVAILQITVVLILLHALELLLIAYSTLTLSRRSYSWYKGEDPPHYYFLPFVVGLICVPRKAYELYSQHEAALRAISLKRRRQLQDPTPVPPSDIGDLIATLPQPSPKPRFKPNLKIEIPAHENELKRDAITRTPTIRAPSTLVLKAGVVIDTIEATQIPPFEAVKPKSLIAQFKPQTKPVVSAEDLNTINSFEQAAANPPLPQAKEKLPMTISAVKSKNLKKKKLSSCLPCG